jgi:hypothetical protein
VEVGDASYRIHRSGHLEEAFIPRFGTLAIEDMSCRLGKRLRQAASDELGTETSFLTTQSGCMGPINILGVTAPLGPS